MRTLHILQRTGSNGTTQGREIMEFWSGLAILIIGLALFVYISSRDWQHETIQLIVMAIFVGVTGFGFALMCQGII